MNMQVQQQFQKCEKCQYFVKIEMKDQHQEDCDKLQKQSNLQQMAFPRFINFQRQQQQVKVNPNEENLSRSIQFKSIFHEGIKNEDQEKLNNTQNVLQTEVLQQNKFQGTINQNLNQTMQFQQKPVFKFQQNNQMQNFSFNKNSQFSNLKPNSNTFQQQSNQILTNQQNKIEDQANQQQNEEKTLLQTNSSNNNMKQSKSVVNFEKNKIFTPNNVIQQKQFNNQSIEQQQQQQQFQQQQIFQNQTQELNKQQHQFQPPKQFQSFRIQQQFQNNSLQNFQPPQIQFKPTFINCNQQQIQQPQNFPQSRFHPTNLNQKTDEQVQQQQDQQDNKEDWLNQMQFSSSLFKNRNHQLLPHFNNPFNDSDSSDENEYLQSKELKNFDVQKKYSDLEVNQMSPEQLYEYFTYIDIQSKKGYESKIINFQNKKEINLNHQERCVICQEDITAETFAKDVQLDCNHLFHFECIKEWLKTDKTCPICKAFVKQIENLINYKNGMIQVI